MAGEPAELSTTAATSGADVPAPEPLQVRSDDGSTPAALSTDVTRTAKPARAPRVRRAYRPSHKATFIALFVVVVLLGINAAVIAFVVHQQNSNSKQSNLGAVTLNGAQLGQLGINRATVGDAAEQLTVTPNTKFTGNVAVAGDISISKQLTLNNKFSAPDAALAQLEAGKTALSSVDVNGDATASNLSLRNGLQVAQAARFQGPVTMSQLLTVNNSLNLAGNLTVGGAITAGGFIARSLTSTSTLTVGGHIITSGSVPGSSQGNAPGPSGTVSVSGNDSAGTIAMNTGGAPIAGTIINIAFRAPFATTPHVIISPVGAPAGALNYFVNRSATGFSLGTANTPSPGTGYAFDYIVEQ